MMQPLRLLGSWTATDMETPNGGAPIRIDQALHGYDRGHRLIRSSRTLDDDSARVMRAMSDLLTPRLLTEEESYLVGYPLKGSASFVLARTWAATDMPRPGSVRTHSLIFDYQSLTTLEDPSVIAGLLMRPSAADLDRFAIPVSPASHPSPDPESTASIDHPSAKSALAALYASKPASRVSIAGFNKANDELLLLALWRQAWPALRRDLAFISALDPKLPKLDASCILSLTGTPAPPCKPSAANCNEALDMLLDDLPRRQQTELRAFVGRHAFDAIEPRAAVLPLVKLWDQLQHASVADLSTAVDNARKHTTSPRLVRDVIDRLLTPPVNTRTLTDFVVRFGSLHLGGPVRALDRVDYETLEGDLATALSVTSREPGGTVGAQAFAHLASKIPLSKLAATPLGDDAALQLAKARPEVLRQPVFWSRNDNSRASLVSVAARNDLPLDTIIALLGFDLGPAVLSSLVEEWPDRAPAMLLNKLGEASHHITKTAHGAALATFLGRSPDVVRAAIASGTRVPAVGADAVIAAAFMAGTVTRPPPAYWLSLTEVDPQLRGSPSLAVLTLCAALIGTGDRATSAILSAFPVVEAAADKRTLPRPAEQYLEASLRDLRVPAWRLADGVLEVAIRTVLSSERGQGRLLMAADGRRQVDAILDALYYRVGLSAVRDVVRSAETMIEQDAIWKIDRSRQFLKSKEKRGWLW